MDVWWFTLNWVKGKSGWFHLKRVSYSHVNEMCAYYP
jgi:hypothetical protein